ncbi:glycoside hydrolase family 10 protein [Moniliophthora roreri]|uniref:GH10 domain-containing protein n=1 Tax=Moniliophthora roreri TaxID=221103 RepID=A0A0W0FWK1_MONRR|nr:glycoside hydrolase family 10 protein [Moniliophthora roreri]
MLVNITADSLDVDVCSQFSLTFKDATTTDSWDVVNEPFNEDGTFRSFAVLYDILGKSYIDIALQAARVADPNSKLYINDYNIDGLGAKSTGMYNLVKDLKA